MAGFYTFDRSSLDFNTSDNFANFFHEKPSIPRENGTN